MLGETSIDPILRVDLQVLDGLTGQDMGLKNLNLVLYTGRIGHKTKILHIGKHLVGLSATIILFVFNKHLGGYLIDRLGIAQVDESATDTNEQRQQEPLPVEHQHGKNVLEIKHRLLFRHRSYFLGFSVQFYIL